MSRKARRIIISLLVFILVLTVMCAVLIPYNFSRSFPQIEGEIQAEGYSIVYIILRKYI